MEEKTKTNIYNLVHSNLTHHKHWEWKFYFSAKKQIKNSLNICSLSSIIYNTKQVSFLSLGKLFYSIFNSTTFYPLPFPHCETSLRIPLKFFPFSSFMSSAPLPSSTGCIAGVPWTVTMSILTISYFFYNSIYSQFIV